MKTKTRKFIWSAPLVAAFAIIGALTLAGVLLMPNADNADAQGFESTAPTVPLNVAAVAGNGKLTITWDAPASNGGEPITAYVVEYVTIATTGTAPDWSDATSETGPGTARRYVATGLNNGDIHAVRVTARNSVGDSDPGVPATNEFTPATVKPDAPTGLMVAQTGDGEITVSWTAPSDNGGATISDYDVYSHNACSSTDLASDGTAVTDADTDATTREVTITGLTVGDTICVAVAADNSATGTQNFARTTTASGAVTIENLAGIIGTVAVPGDITSSSTSGGSTVEIKVVINSLPIHLPVGSSIVLYLEDDYQEPSSIPASAVYFVATGGDTTDDGTNFGTGNNDEAVTSNGARVYATSTPDIATDDYFDADKDDISIRVIIPDMCDLEGCVGGPRLGQMLTMVISKAAGIKNPSEDGDHSVAFRVIGATDDVPGPDDVTKLKDLSTHAKASLSPVDGGRGDEITVKGTGFNNGTSATAYVMQADSEPDCGPAFIAGGSRLGAATVGSDDIVQIPVTVTVPTFKPGNVNWICIADGEQRYSAKAQDFKLDPSIRVSPSTANVGDTVTVFAQDFEPNQDIDLGLELANVPAGHMTRGFETSGGDIGRDGSGSATFTVPGWAEGTLRVDAWGENTKLTVIGSTLKISKGSALPNELLTITGDGFSTGVNNYVSSDMVTIDGVPLEVHEDSLNRDDQIDVSNSGQFVATVVLWPASGATNPTLTAGVHTIEVTDSNGYSGSATITIPDPSVSLTPTIAGPRDVITISGENWPVDNIEGSTPPTVMIDVEDGRPRTYSALPDSAGRWFVEHRVSGAVAIPSTNRVTAKVGSEIVKVVTFEVPAAIIDVSPGEGQPGDTITLMVDKMPVYAAVDSIQIAGRDVLPVGNFSTDRTGAVTVEGVVLPGLDPGTYSVLMDIDDTVAIGSVNVLAEVVGTDTATADALAPLGDSLVAAFYFDNVSKTWSFYDPRPEFADLNTLSSLIQGEAYWVLVSDNVADVVLNNKSRTLTCSGGDCWNLVIW